MSSLTVSASGDKDRGMLRHDGNGDPSTKSISAKLQFTPRFKSSAASIFNEGMFNPVTSALLEFPDNSIAHRNRHERGTRIEIVISRNLISVTDHGGKGGDERSIDSFLSIGRSDQEGISYRGAGAKFAAWLLATDLEIAANTAGSKTRWIMRSEGFGDPTKAYEGEIPITPAMAAQPYETGSFEIKLTGIKQPERLMPQSARLIRTLGEVYRPLLKDGLPVIGADGSITADGVVVSMSVTHGKTQAKAVMPIPIPLLPGYAQAPRIKATDAGERLVYWAGAMDVKNGNGLRDGIRCYLDGRLIQVDHFGYNPRDPRLAALTGEVHLDEVRGIKDLLGANKSAGIEKASDTWKNVTRAMHSAIEDVVKDLTRTTTRVDIHQEPEFLGGVVLSLKRMANRYLVNNVKSGVFTQTEINAIFRGETMPITGMVQTDAKVRQKKGTKTPGTPQTQKKIRVRVSLINGYRYEPLQDTHAPSMMIVQRDKNHLQRIIVLNSAHPLVRSAMNDGRDATAKLLVREFADNLARALSSDLDQFVKLRDKIGFELADMLAGNVK